MKRLSPALRAGGALPPRGAELVAQVTRAIWRFLHDTSHPQVRDTNPDEINFAVMDKATLRKMESALMKILLLSAEEGAEQRAVTANLGLTAYLEGPAALQESPPGSVATQSQQHQPGARVAGTREHHPESGMLSSAASAPSLSAPKRSGGGAVQETTHKPSRTLATDPFWDLKAVFEPPKEKQRTFNLKQIVTRNGTVLMNMLERLLENTEIDAIDVETDQTLLEYACNTGNMGLAKLCYRRGANLSAKTKKGDSPFTIVTRARRYDMMEFLHSYGVKVNSCDSKGRTALHVAAANDDVDAVCRLIEWGADVNIYDHRKRTPIHDAAAGGNTKTTMLLLEVGADMNAKDEREYTAVAHAEANNHFALMDRLVQLGGRGHGLSQKSTELCRSKSAKTVGELVVSAGMLKSSPLGRIGKVAVSGMPGLLRPCSPELAKAKTAPAGK